MQNVSPSNCWFVFDDLSERCLGNVELMQRVITAFSDNAQHDIATIESAIHETDFETLATTAHRIKGSAANAAAQPMSKLAAEIEQAARQRDETSLKDLLYQLQESFDGFLALKEDHLPSPPPQTL